MSNMFSMSDTSTSSGESKHYNMKVFIKAASEYIKTRSEDSASAINRHLQLLSVAIDYSIFDPNTSVVCEFFVSLHELLSNLEPRSTLAWCCVSVLSVACGNGSARNALIHTYQFIPALSRLLGDHLTPAKKIQLLTLMQELSCGLKISWLIPNLSYLMTTLTKSIEQEGQNEQIMMLSLGVLVNLCYKNLPAIYTLSRCVDIKKFVRVCAKLKGVQMEVSVIKLLIILDYIHGVVPDEAFIKLINLTFKSIHEAYVGRDAILLRQVVGFYLDVKEQKANVDNINIIMEKCNNYYEDVQKLLQLVDNNLSAGDASQNDPECMSMIFQFLHSLIEMQLPKLAPLYPTLAQLSLRWIQTEAVCSEALNVLCTIALSSSLEETHIMEPLLTAVPVFLVGLQNIESDSIMNIEHCKSLGAVMRMLKVLVQANSTREPLLNLLNEQLVCKIFVPLIGDSSPRTRATDANNCTPEAVSLYLYTLDLMHELAKISANWVTPLSGLLQNKQIHMILADALYNGVQDIKSLVLNMASYSLFPYRQAATAMFELQAVVCSNNQNPANTNTYNNLMCYPLVSTAQSEKLDETIRILKEACNQNHVANVSTSDVMELYEYKLASMGHAESAAIASVEAASQRCTHLQHQTAQLTAEISRIRQLFIHTQQNVEDLRRSSNELEENNRDLLNRVDAEKGRTKVVQSQLSHKERELNLKSAELEEHAKRLRDKELERSNLEDENNKLKGFMQKLEDNLKRQEKNSERKDEAIKKANANIEHLKLQMTQIEKQFKQTELQLQLKSKELTEVSKELEEKSNLINTITRLTNSTTQK